MVAAQEGQSEGDLYAFCWIY